MKKVLSFVLVLAMVLGTVSMAFATFDDMKDSKYAKAVDALYELGVVNGFSATTFGPEKTITRAQFAKMVVSALALDPKGAGKTSFPDVKATSVFAPYIEIAKDLGIIEGFADGTFKPDQTVTNTQAIVMVVRALGYTNEYFGGYNAAKYLNKAVALGITKDVATGNAGSTRGNVAQLIFNSLETPIYVYVSGNVNTYTVGTSQLDALDTDTMLIRLSGKLYAPYKDAENDGKPGTAFVYGGKYGDYTVDSTEVAKGVKMANYLGKYVVAFANKSNEITGVKEVKSVALTGKLTTTAAVGTELTFKADDVEYSLGLDKIGTPVAIYNGVVTNASFDVWSAAAVAQNVTLEVKLSGKTIKEVYSMAKWDVDNEFVFKADMLDTEDCELYNFDFAKNDDKEIDLAHFALLGVDKLADIKEGNIVTVYLDPADKYIKKIEVGTKTIEGRVAKVTSDTKYVIADTKYSTSAALAEGTDELNAGSEGTFYLNYAGKIAKFSGNTSDVFYGVVTDIANGDTGISEKDAKVQIFTTDNKKVILAADKYALKTDEKTWKNYQITTQAVAYTKTTADKVYTIVTNGSVSTNVEFTQGAFSEQVEILKTGVVSGADFTAKINTDTKIISVDNLGKYSVIVAKDLFGTKNVTVNAMAYNKKTGLVNFLFIAGSEAEATDYVLFNGWAKIDGGADEDPYWEAKAFCNGVETTYKITEDMTATAKEAKTAEIYTLTFSEGKVTTVSAVDPAYTSVGAVSKTALEGDVLVAYNGDVQSAYYSLASDVVVYVWNADDKVWKLGKAADLASSKAGEWTINLYKTGKNGEVTFATIAK